MKELDVVIITRNRSKSLRRLLDSLVRQTIPLMKVSVIDNGSTDRTREVVKSFSKLLPIHYIKESKVGIPSARNRGLGQSAAKIVAFIDDDCEADPNWAKEIITSHAKYPKIVAVQGKVLSRPQGGIFPIIFEAVYSYWLHKNIFKRKYLKVIDTKNVSLKMHSINKLGLRFDNYFKRGSDVDFANQLLSKGQKILFSKEILIYHWERGDLVSFFKQRWQSGKTQAGLEAKWPQSLPAFDRSRETYRRFVSKIGANSPVYKRIIALVLFKVYGPLFKLSFQKYKNNDSLLALSPVYRKKGKISVGVITKNRPGMLKRTLFSLFKQTVKPSEVIIVDGAPSIESKKIAFLFSKKLNIRYIVQKKKGIGNARNLVLRNARENIIGFVDDDCEADISWVESMLLAHQRHPQAAIIQGHCEVDPYGGLVSRIYQADYNNWILHNLRGRNQLVRADIENSSLKADCLAESGIHFDEEKKFYYSDDVDLSYQAISRGGEIIYYPKAILNVRRRSFFSLLVQRIRKGYSAGLTDLKWGEVQNLNMLILKGRVIPMAGVNVGNISQFFRVLPSVSILGKFLLPLLAGIYKLLFKLSYSFTRSQIDLDVSRLEKEYFPKSNIRANRDLSISVMVITKDRPEGLRRLLSSLVIQTLLPKEIIIVDSSLKSIEPVLEEFPDLVFKYLYEKRKGYSFARNRAIKACSGDVIATVDDDAVVSENWIKNIKRAHQTYPGAVAVQGKIVSLPGNSVISIVEQLHMDKWFLRNLELDGRFNTLSTKNASFKTKLLGKNQIKFNELEFFNRYGGEDVDFANQIISKSGEIRYSASIRIYHYERRSIADYIKQRIRKGGSGALISFYWGYLPYRKFYSFSPRFFEIFIIPLKFLSLKKTLFYYFFIIPIYFAAEAAFIQGRKIIEKKLENFLQPIYPLKNEAGGKKLPTVTIGIILEDNQSVKTLLEQVLRQSLKAKKIIFYLGMDDKRNEQILLQLKKSIDISIMKSNKNKLSKVNDLINSFRTDILCVLSDRRKPTLDWSRNLVKAHLKLPGISVIQGQTIFKESFFRTNLINHFIWQTLMRNSMLSGRNNYWDWIKGFSKARYGLNIVDINNFSIKIPRNIDHSMRFQTGNKELAAEILFAYNQRNVDSPVTMETRAKVILSDRNSISYFITKGYNDGAGAINSRNMLSKNQEYLRSVNFIKRVLAFNYFLLNRGVFWQAAILNFIYLLYLGGFYWGIINFYLRVTLTSKTFVKKLFKYSERR